MYRGTWRSIEHTNANFYQSCTLVFKVKPWCMDERCNPPYRRSEEKDWWESWRNKTSRPITASNYDIGGSDLLARNEITEDIFRSHICYDMWIHQYLRLASLTVLSLTPPMRDCFAWTNHLLLSYLELISCLLYKNIFTIKIFKIDCQTFIEKVMHQVFSRDCKYLTKYLKIPQKYLYFKSILRI